MYSVVDVRKPDAFAGLFISLEGIDFSGKSLQCLRLREKLVREWADGDASRVLLFREPGGTEISERIREILLDRSLFQMDPHTELLLYAAARSQLVMEKIVPALREGHIVICDRFHDSTTAYQGYGRGIPLELIEKAHELGTHGILPDLTIVLDLPPERAFARQIKAHRSRDRMESEQLDFYRRVRDGFRQLASREPGRVKLVNADRPVEEISGEIWDMVWALISSRIEGGSGVSGGR
jgi:dTMP kinase